MSELKLALHFCVFFLPICVGLPSCAEKSATVDFAKEVEPILAEHCYDCHGDGMDKGDVALDRHGSIEETLADRGMWEGVYTNLDTHLMPPSDKTQPTDEERATILAWIEDDVFKLERKNPDPGKPVIRRLNRVEYNNAIRDLFGIDLRPADKFPADDTGYGFDNVGDVLSLSPTLLEKYLQAGEEVMDVVIPTEPLRPDSVVFHPGEFTKRKGGPDPDSGTMASSGTLGGRFTVKREGQYLIKIAASGSQAKKDWPILQVKVEGGPQKDFRIPSGESREYSFAALLKTNPRDRWVDVSFLNDLYDPEAKDPNQRDRNAFLQRIEISGPIGEKPPPPAPIYTKLLSEAGAANSESGKARSVLEKVGLRAWRRPLAKADLDRLEDLFTGARQDGQTFDESLKLAMKGILISQRFLFRGEEESAEDRGRKAGSYALVDEYSLASRLSFFLWSSLPDDELLRLAGEGQLRKQLRPQIQRMLEDKKAEALTDNFAGQWLQLRNLALSHPDPNRFKGWNNQLRDSMREETEQFFTYIIKENRSVLEFINANYSFLDRRLADHYGMSGQVKDDHFRKVVFSGRELEQRGGILTQASILTITSDSTRTSPVNRGNYVLENILGTIPPPPPAGIQIPALEDAGKGQNNLTLRQQLEIHRKDKLCSSCHARMDPIGFAMENFDGFGKWRDKENGQVIDTSGKLYTGESFAGITGLRDLLARDKSEAFMKCLAEKMLTYALGRGMEYYDKPALHEIVTRATGQGYRSRELITAIVESVPFQKTRVMAKDVP